jgi:hypothetical protein
MSMLDETALVLAFRTKLDTLAGIPDASHRAWENREFEPELDAEWLRETLVIGDEERSSTGLNESFGQIRYDVLAPIGEGTTNVRAIAKAIAEGFEAGQTLQNGGLSISIEKSTRLPGRQAFTETGGSKSLWYMVPVAVFWRVFTATSF